MRLFTKIKMNIKLNSNNNILFKNISGAFIIKGCSLLVSLLTMPIFISYFGNKSVLGVWYTVLSVITWILNFDLGIGNGLRNHLVKSIAENDEKRSRQIITSSYVMFGALVFIFTFVGCLVSSLFNWNELLNISADLISTKSLSEVIRYIFVGIMLQLFFNTITSILYALQKSAINNLISLIISISQLVFVLFAPSGTPQHNLILLSKAYILLTTVPYLVVTIIIFNTLLKRMSPRFRDFNWRTAKQIMSMGGLFFACQLLYMIIINTNEFFITSFTEPQNTVDYNIYNKLFMLVGTLVALALTPLWSMITKTLAEKQYKWLFVIYKKAQRVSVIAAFFELLLVLVLQIVINVWLGRSAIRVNYIYAIIFSIWGALFVYVNTLSTFACGTGKLKLQAWCYGIGAIVKVIILIFIYTKYRSWIFVVISNIIVLLPYSIIQRCELSKYFHSLLVKEESE